MKIWNSMLAALGMYSRLPVRNVDWTKENMCYSMCFVPLIGVFIGVLQYLAWWVCAKINGNTLLFACLFTVIPILVTGGIHMDGFCDTVDALSSFRTKEKRLEILKDPHIGSFAVIGCCCYLLLQTGFASGAVHSKMVLIMCMAPVLSRCGACFMAISMRNAKKEGTLYSFTSVASKATSGAVLVLVGILTCGLAVGIDPIEAMLMILGMAIVLLHCVLMARKQFGGVTGDIIGFSLQVIELAGVIFAAIGGMLWNLL